MTRGLQLLPVGQAQVGLVNGGDVFQSSQTILVEYLVLLHLSESEEKYNVCA